MGRQAGEPLVRLAEVQVVSVRRERLSEIIDEDSAREGFPEFDVGDFVAFFCEDMNVEPHAEVTPIEWRYLDSDEPTN